MKSSKTNMVCPVCNGKGTLPNPYKVPSPTGRWKCWRCKGTGEIRGANQ